MRVKIRGKAPFFEVVDADSGELVQGVTYVGFFADNAGERSLNLRLVSFDVDIEDDAVIERTPICMCQKGIQKKKS